MKVIKTKHIPLKERHIEHQNMQTSEYITQNLLRIR